MNTLDDQSQLGRLVQAEDAYRALELLEKHPRIDPDKMILMKFFHGGVAFATRGRWPDRHASGARAIPSAIDQTGTPPRTRLSRARSAR
ncbi:protein of unknown function (plasmid) [Paraburkholderia dioscoreae]|uniref:Uncharacterized protein n=1 Tax=Paraburkholderia dioscoreae TaxID=2604047 RepID=A0A5Q4ZQW2_9BURK|nr:protein of unknown function [Paraburkholderia dioscoreae]